MTEDNYLQLVEEKKGRLLTYDEWEKARAYYAKRILGKMREVGKT